MDSSVFLIDTGVPILNEIIKLLFANALQITISAALITLYAVIIWHYYRSMAKRDFFTTKEKEGKGMLLFIYNFFLKLGTIVQYIVLYPLMSFSFFTIFALLLFLLSKEQPIASILFISAAFISAIRITSYYSEDLSRDLAKMVPLGLLGVFIVDSSFFSLPLLIERVQTIPLFVLSIFSFILYFLLLELALKILYGLKKLFLGKSKKLEETKD